MMRNLLLAVWLMLTLTGCATAKLWEWGRMTDYTNRPAPHPDTQIKFAPKVGSVAVEYNEQNECSGKILRRCYVLEDNEELVRKYRKPVFANPTLCQAAEWQVLPLCPSPPPYRNSCATLQGPDFKVYVGGQLLASSTLPIYDAACKHNAGRTTVAVLLTPPAVLVDLTIVGGIIVAIFGPDFAYAYANHQGAPCH